jgi:protein Tex
MTESQIVSKIAAQLNLKPAQVKTVAILLDEGATIPFLARYRREVTGDLDELELRNLRDALHQRRALEERRKTILDSIREQGKLSPELEAMITQAEDLASLEDLYLPYKPKRKTKASIAREKGLEPLAMIIWEQKTRTGKPEEYAIDFLSEEKSVLSIEDALQGACDICAEMISEIAEIRAELRDYFRKYASIRSKKKSSVEARTVFETYYEFSIAVKHIKPYQILALNRGEKENILSVDIDVVEDETLGIIDHYVIENDDHIFHDLLVSAIDDSYKRLLFPAMERELRSVLTEEADAHAIITFAQNVRNLLMQSPLKSKTVLGIDPGFRTGCKVAVVDPFGNYLEGTTIYPTEPYKKTHESEAILDELVRNHQVEIIAIGNGTASRETEQFVADFIRNHPYKHIDLHYLIVNEAGASVYSASDIAREEFPDLDAAQRGNISIARRIQDPLAELVKIDPKSIGVGLYQHDVDQTGLEKSLYDVVESCVNTVGVNLNTASAPLLHKVSGLNRTLAGKIIEFRIKEGPFKNRNQLLEIPGMGPFRFQQAAGFLRIPESTNPFDNTAIHPESYEAAEQLCKKFNIDVTRLPHSIESVSKTLKNIDVKSVASELEIGVPTLELIIENLLKPGRDPREALPKPLLRQDVLKLDDLAEGMVLEGTIRNVVDFGAFVDIGVKEDGLIHISKMGSNGKRIENPHDVVAVNDIVKVKILSIDKNLGRIGLELVKN